MKNSQTTVAKEKRKFGFLDYFSYAAGDFGCNMSFSLKGTVQTFWLVYMMLETGLLAALLLVVQIWDAINDPLIGSIIDADKRKYKMGKFKTYILIGAIGLLVAGALCFIPVPNASLIVKCIVFIAGYIIWDACYTIANVPYGSMLSLISTDAGERAQLSTWRSLGSIIGNMVPIAILPMLIWKKEVDANGNPIVNPETGVEVETFLGERVFWVAIVMGVLGFIAFIFMIKNTVIRVDEKTVKTNTNEKFNIFKAFGNFFRNRAAMGATLAAVAMFLGMNSATTATTIMFATYFGMARLSGVVSVIAALPMVAFVPFIKKIVDKWGKKEASVVGTAVSVFGGLLMLVFPLIQNKTIALVMYIIALCVFGFGMGIYNCLSWAFMADAIDYNEWKTGKREEGTVYSLHSFFRKLAQGVGPSIVLVLMGALGYVSKLGTAGQSLETVYNMCWLVAGLYLFSAVLQFISIAFIYNIDKKTLAKMNEDLGYTTKEKLEEGAIETPAQDAVSDLEDIIEG